MRSGVRLSREESDRGHGGGERKKADSQLAARNKALNYTVKASQE